MKQSDSRDVTHLVHVMAFLFLSLFWPSLSLNWQLSSDQKQVTTEADYYAVIVLDNCVGV